jgi:16S rRNA (uracil1498-N3)-methyltransferase
MPVFFITADQIQNGSVTITGSLCTHLRDSLRLRVGEEFWLGDERRRRYRVITTRIDRKTISGTVLEQSVGQTPAHPLILGQALLKGDRMDWVIQKATELGMASLTPLISSHVIVRPHAARQAAQQDRWQRIALEAAQQSERWECPRILIPCEASDFFKQRLPSPVNLILSERGPWQSITSIPLPSGSNSLIRIAVGPEGGWRPEELDYAIECGFSPVTLGKRILRAETATLAALSVIQSRLGELG